MFSVSAPVPSSKRIKTPTQATRAGAFPLASQTGLAPLSGDCFQTASTRIQKFQPLHFQGKTPDNDIPKIPMDGDLGELWNEFAATAEALFGEYQDREKRAEGLTNTVWATMIEPQLRKNPEEIRRNLTQWENSITQEGTPGLIRQTTLMALRHINANLDNPDALKETLRVSILLIANGGYRKLTKLATIVSSNDFRKGTPIQQGQQVIEALGPIFIKLLQTLSTMPGLFDPAVQKSMTPLYEDITPVPFAEIKQIVESSLGKPLSEAYAWFNPEPLNTASIAQVHEARLHNGQRVAVKVVKGNVQQCIKEDLDMLKPMAKLAHQIYPALDAESMFHGLGEQLKKECNMDEEAQRLKAVRSRLRGFSDLYAPRVIDSHTKDSVLTMEFIEAKNLLNFKGDSAIAKRYLKRVLDQIFTIGACQMEPHPGNMPFNAEKNFFAFLDAGTAYFPTPKEQTDFAKLLVALSQGNADLLTQALIPNASRNNNRKAVTAFKTALQPLCTKQNLSESDAILKLVTQATILAHQNGLEVNPINPMLWRTVFTGVMVSKTLNPDIEFAPVFRNKLVAHLFQHDKRFLSDTLVSKVRSWWAGK